MFLSMNMRKKDRSMKRFVAALILLTPMLFLCCSRTPPGLQGHAMVVGVSDYPVFDYKLSGAASDGKRVAKQLTEIGYQVTSLIDDQATPAAFSEALNALIAAPAGDGLKIIYFSGLAEAPGPRAMGHPISTPFLWAPKSTDKYAHHLHSYWMPFDEINRRMRDKPKSGRYLFVFDYPVADRPFSIYAGDGERKAWSLGSSVAGIKTERGELTDAFLDGIADQGDIDGDGNVSVEELVRFILTESLRRDESRPAYTDLEPDQAQKVMVRKGGDRHSPSDLPPLDVLIREMNRAQATAGSLRAQQEILRICSDDKLRIDLRIQALLGFLRHHENIDQPQRKAKALLVKLRSEMKNGPPDLTDPRRDMKPIPGGTFEMGCDPDKFSCTEVDGPKKTATVDDFYMDTTEVTLDAFKLCSYADKCYEADSAGDYCVNGRDLPGDVAVNCVNWINARAFCAFAGKRLPTEAEWERAARGDDQRKYAWGNTFENDHCNWAEHSAHDGYETIAPVGKFPKGASPYGVLDLNGNLSELVEDAYVGPRLPYAISDPNAPDAKTGKLSKGGGWGALPHDLTNYRQWILAENMEEGNWGFRCAWSPKSSKE